ncbi:MAG: hypothetical protein ACK5KU_04350 [Beutenbergiaceae bacterium]
MAGSLDHRWREAAATRPRSNRYGALPVGALVGAMVLPLLGVAAVVWASTIQARVMSASARYAGLLAVVVGLFFVLLVLRHWQHDRGIRQQLDYPAGPPLSEHSRNLGGGILWWVFGVAALGFGLYFVLLGIARPEPTSYLLATFGTGLFGLGIGLWALIATRPGHGTLIEVFSHGVRVVSRSTVLDLPWPRLRYLVTRGNDGIVHLIRGPGLKAVEVNSLSDYAQLQRQLAWHTTHEQVPEQISAITGGQPRQFGSITLTQEGLRWRNKQVSWTDYEGMYAPKHVIQVWRRPGTRAMKVPVVHVREFGLLLTLANQLGHAERPPPVPPTLGE